MPRSNPRSDVNLVPNVEIRTCRKPRETPMRAFVATIVWLAVGLGANGGAFGQSDTTGGPTQSPSGAMVYFVDLKDGATIGPKTTIHFGLHGMGVARQVRIR